MAAMTALEMARELGQDVRGLTRTEDDALVETGLLSDEKVELLNGMIVQLAAKGVPHDTVVQWLTMRFARRLPEHLHVRVQSGWAATNDSEPEPDLAIVPARWTAPGGARSHPHLAELIIEVAASSLRRGLRIKADSCIAAATPGPATLSPTAMRGPESESLGPTAQCWAARRA